MRRVSRPDQLPETLSTDGIRLAKIELFEFLRRSPAERQQRRAPLNDAFFYDSELTVILYDLFAGKCAYCETPLKAPPIVRHFRPLSFAEPLSGINGNQYYAWLAYEWQNLILACDFCEKAKGSAFPLQRGSRSTYLARIDDVREQEYPMLLDPCIDDPRRHLQFLSDGSCVHKTERGAATIATLGLNRDDLIADRREATNDWFGLLTYASGQLEFADKIRSFRPPGLFHLGTPHLAAGLDILRRVLNAWRGTSSRDVAQAGAFLRHVSDELRAADVEARESLVRAASDLRSSDEARGPAMRRATAGAAQSELVDTGFAKALPKPAAYDREIRKISISHMKAIDALEIEMPASRSRSGSAPCLAILGENSTGKSTLLSAIALALIGANQARRLKLGGSHLLSSVRTDRLDQLDAWPASVDIEYNAFAEHARFSLDPETDKVDGQQAPMSVVLGYGPRRYFSPRYRRRSNGARQRVRTLFDPLATIPYPNDWLASLADEKFDTVARALRIVLALNDEDRLVNDPEDGMCVEANGRRTPVEWLSEGYKSVFAMVVDILHELLDHYPTIEQAQAIVLIDEIETHLHPRWKMQIMTSLRQALPRVQFIVTTHDPLCLRGMDDGEVIVLQRVEGAKIRRLENLPSVKGMSAEQLLTSDYFGLSSTTDPTVDLALARLTGDVVSRDGAGGRVVELSAQTEKLLKSLSLGDSPSETIVQDALKTYLSDRETPKGELRTDVRADAVEAVLKALTAPPSA